MIKHYNITVTGKVQGVFFRVFTQTEAQRLHINGFVRNQPNGDVYIEAEAEEIILKEFVSWCKKGSPQSTGEEVNVKEADVKKHIGFTIDKS